MSHTATLEDLRNLFTGVPQEGHDQWSTTPSHNVGLAFEIAKRCDAQTEYALRTILYDNTSPDDIPGDALSAIRLGAQRYRQHRDLQRAARRGRGL